MIVVTVRGNNLDAAFRALKKKVQREGTFKKYKESLAYLKPSVKRKVKTAEMIKRKKRRRFGD